MLIKVIIVILFVAVVLSLSSALLFLLKDSSSDPSKRSLYALAIRLSLASILIVVIVVGLYTGEISSTAPWDQIH